MNDKIKLSLGTPVKSASPAKVDVNVWVYDGPELLNSHTKEEITNLAINLYDKHLAWWLDVADYEGHGTYLATVNLFFGIEKISVCMLRIVRKPA